MTVAVTGLSTIGHSNRSIDEFVSLLEAHAIGHVVDVRKLAGSRRYPQFNADALAESLADRSIAFSRNEGLTGRRPVSRDVPSEVNGWWENRSFHNYADHALSAQFGTALGELRALGESVHAAVMCSEAVWWRCHRRIIADHLIAGGATVEHVMGPGPAATATLSSGAVRDPERGVVYPA